MLITLPIDTAVLLADDLDAFNDDQGTNRQARKALVWKLRWAAKLGAKQITLEGADTTGINWVRFYEEDAEEVKKEEEEVAIATAQLHQQINAIINQGVPELNVQVVAAIAASQEPKNSEAEKPKDEVTTSTVTLNVEEQKEKGLLSETTSEAEQEPSTEQAAPKKRGRPVGWRKPTT